MTWQCSVLKTIRNRLKDAFFQITLKCLLGFNSIIWVKFLKNISKIFELKHGKSVKVKVKVLLKEKLLKFFKEFLKIETSNLFLKD